MARPRRRSRPFLQNNPSRALDMKKIWFALLFFVGGISHEIRNPVELPVHHVAPASRAPAAQSQVDRGVRLVPPETAPAMALNAEAGCGASVSCFDGR